MTDDETVLARGRAVVRPAAAVVFFSALVPAAAALQLGLFLVRPDALLVLALISQLTAAGVGVWVGAGVLDGKPRQALVGLVAGLLGAAATLLGAVVLAVLYGAVSPLLWMSALAQAVSGAACAWSWAPARRIQVVRERMLR